MTSEIKVNLFLNEHLSNSRLKLYEQCALAFYFRYVGPKGPPAPRSEPAAFGVVLHAALEALYKWIIAEEYAGPLPGDKLLGFYQDAWMESKLTGVELYQEGLNILRTYAKSHEMVDHFDILASEQEFNIVLDGFPVNGYIDLVVKIDDDTIEIRDFKSNRNLYTQDEVENDLQLSLYGIVAHQLYPWAKVIRFSFEMLRFDRSQRTTRTVQQLEDAKGYVVSLGKQTESDTTWAPTLNANCSYCDSRARCSAYQDGLKNGLQLTKMKDLLSVEAMLEERERVAKFAKAAYGRKDEIDDLLKAKIKNEGEFETSEWTCKLVPASYDTTYNASGVLYAFQLAGVNTDKAAEKIMSINKKAVDAFAAEVGAKLSSGRRTLLETMIAASKTSSNTPKIDLRRKKKKKTDGLSKKTK